MPVEYERLLSPSSGSPSEPKLAEQQTRPETDLPPELAELRRRLETGLADSSPERRAAIIDRTISARRIELFLCPYGLSPRASKAAHDAFPLLRRLTGSMQDVLWLEEHGSQIDAWVRSNYLGCWERAHPEEAAAEEAAPPESEQRREEEQRAPSPPAARCKPPTPTPPVATLAPPPHGLALVPSRPRKPSIPNPMPHEPPADALATFQRELATFQREVGSYGAVWRDLYRLGKVERSTDGNPRRVARVSVAGLAKRLGRCDRTVERALRWLRDQRWVRPLVRGRKIGGRAWCSAYELPVSLGHVRFWRSLRREKAGLWWRTAGPFYAGRKVGSRPGTK